MVSSETLLQVLPAFRGKEYVITKKQSTNAILKEVTDAHNVFKSDYNIIAGYFYDANPYILAGNLFSFCKKNLPYVIESEKSQTTRSPSGIIAMAAYSGVDCKHYAGFIGGVIDAVNRLYDEKFQWYYRFACYDFSGDPGHVFVVLKDLNGADIWVDPVLDNLNQRIPFPLSTKDKKISGMLKRMSGVAVADPIAAGSQVAVSNTQITAANVATQQTGKQTIAEVATALEVVGTALDVTGVGAVAGVILNAVGALVGLASKFLGSNWYLNNEVRWMIQQYQYYVLGDANVKTDNDVDQTKLNAALSWFAAVYGVPVYDANTVEILNNRGVNGQPKPAGYSPAECAARYLAYPQIKNLAANVTIEQAEQAAVIGNALFNYYSDNTYSKIGAPGSWANFPTAQYWVDLAATEIPSGSGNLLSTGQQLTVTKTGEIVPLSSIVGKLDNFVAWCKANPLLCIAGIIGIGGVVYVIANDNKKKK